MSAQSTDKQVNKINKEFFKILKKPIDWIKLWTEKIKEYIKSISFFNNKANNIFKTCKILESKYNWNIPKNLKELTSLAWVWIKTAKVFLAVIEDAPYIWVDTHVHRVLNRIWFVNTKNPLETDKKISKNFTKKNHAKLHNTLVLFWRYHCTARKPKCDTCPFKQNCKYFNKNLKLWN
jgi:endonuclease-3